MCGIIGYLGHSNKTVNVLIDGLRRLEYRGYDSAGVAIGGQGGSTVIKSSGKLDNLVSKLSARDVDGPAGIGHTRWATHGKSSEENAHPHRSGSTIVVHNGIVENFLELKDLLTDKGYEFSSDTDTEVIAHLIEDYISSGLKFVDAVIAAFESIEGSNAVVVMSDSEPDKIVGVKKFSPLVLAIGDGEHFFASDPAAVLPFTNDVVFLEDGDFAVIDGDGYRILDGSGGEVEREVSSISWDPVQVEKGGFKHFMLKEIYEQPRAVLDTMSGSFDLDSGKVFFEGFGKGFLEGINRIVLTACGTSYHAGLIGKNLLERLAGIPVDVELASELRYREPVLDGSTLLIAISQSGETADTSEALLMAGKMGARTAALTNVDKSKITREADSVILTHAGPEIGVASTKAFTTQLIALYFFSILCAQTRGKLSDSSSRELIKDALKLPKLMEIALKLDDSIKEIAKDFYKFNNFLYLGRGLNYPIALEGALKLKEISYIHAEGYSAGEMKHGPIALVDENMPVVIIAPDDGPLFNKGLGNLEEINARGGRIIFVTTRGHENTVNGKVERVITLPSVNFLLTPILTVLPLQMLAYHMAAFKGTDIDQPRNLAKVVTVE